MWLAPLDGCASLSRPGTGDLCLAPGPSAHLAIEGLLLPDTQEKPEEKSVQDGGAILLVGHGGPASPPGYGLFHMTGRCVHFLRLETRTS